MDSIDDLWAMTPAVLPAPEHVLAEAPYIRKAVRATDAGFDDDKNPGRERPSDEQLAYMKLFFAHSLWLSSEQKAIAIGIDHSKVGKTARDEFNSAWKGLDNNFGAIRTKTFGPSSYLNALVKASVTRHDFEATVFNIQREVILAQVAPEGETPTEQTARHARLSQLEDARTDHLQRLYRAYDFAYEDALAAYNSAQDNKESPRKVAILHRKMMHYKQLKEEKWEPSNMQAHSHRAAVPGPKLRYFQKPPETRQLFWTKIYNVDVGTNILWDCKDVLSIEHTLQDEDYHHFISLAFTVIANDLWRFSIGIALENHLLNRLLKDVGVRSVVEMKDLRTSHAYATISTLHRDFFSGDNELPGFTMLWVPDHETKTKKSIKSPRSPRTKRKITETVTRANFSFTRKRRA